MSHWLHKRHQATQCHLHKLHYKLWLHFLYWRWTLLDLKRLQAQTHGRANLSLRQPKLLCQWNAFGLLTVLSVVAMARGPVERVSDDPGWLVGWWRVEAGKESLVEEDLLRMSGWTVRERVKKVGQREGRTWRYKNVGVWPSGEDSPLQ
jgi:hypothetical protein